MTSRYHGGNREAETLKIIIQTMKKITIATIKSFIRKNQGSVYIKVNSTFDGMIDCVATNKDAAFNKAEKTDRSTENTLGISGAWFVGRSRDHFNVYENGSYKGFEIYNCCGSFIIATIK